MYFVKKYCFLLPLILLFSVHSLQSQNETKTDSTLNSIIKLKEEANTSLLNQEFSDALINLNKAYRDAVTADSDSIKHDIKLSIAKIHYYIQNYDKANLEVDKATSLLTENSNPLLYATTYTLKGLIETQLGNYVTADNYFAKADRIYIDANNETKRANVLLGLGVLELKKLEYIKAINYFDAAIPVFKDNNLDYHLAMALLSKADALLALDKTNKNIALADKSYNEAKTVLENQRYNRLNIKSYSIASKLCQAKGDQEGALLFLEKYAKEKDKSYNKYYRAISNGTDEESNVDDLKETIELQNIKMEKDQQSINFIKYTTGLSIALIIILSLFALSLYKNNILRAKANNLLLDKNTELQLSKEKAEQASLAKAQFLSTVTHELRTPLYAVTGLTHLLLAENPKPDQKEHLKSLKFSGEYLLSLINNILDLNKLEANKVEIENRTFDLRRRINDVIIALKKSAEDKNNKVTLEFDPSLPDMLMGDSVKLSQVLINLIGNSLKFTQNGYVTIRVNKIEEKAERILLHFEVEDDGVGISKKKQKTIFESFSQASLQVNRKFGGTGLGLSIVKNLLELMNSKIHLESELGKGSKFWFNIALNKVESNTSDIDGSSPKAALVDFSLFENKRVLVVEDNKINQMITRKILEKNKLICQVTDNGLDAVKLVEENRYDVVLMDIHMPGISGIEATQKIRKFNSNIPIIALTAVTIDENLDEFYKAGFNDIIPKPFKTEEFFEKIYSILIKKELIS